MLPLATVNLCTVGYVCLSILDILNFIILLKFLALIRLNLRISLCVRVSTLGDLPFKVNQKFIHLTYVLKINQFKKKVFSLAFRVLE